MFPLLFTGRRKQLDEDDVWELPTRMRARSVHERYAERCLKYPHMTLRQHMVRMFWPRWVVAGLCYVGWCVCAGAQPFLVSAIVSHLQDDNATTSDGAWLAFALFVSTLWCVDARSHPPTHPLSHQHITHTNTPRWCGCQPIGRINKRASLQYQRDKLLAHPRTYQLITCVTRRLVPQLVFVCIYDKALTHFLLYVLTGIRSLSTTSSDFCARTEWKSDLF